MIKTCGISVCFHIPLIFLMLLVLNFLSGCASDTSDSLSKPRLYVRNTPIPIPVPQEKPSSPEKGDLTPLANTAENVTVVAKGETLYKISSRTAVPVATLIDLNGLTPPYTVFPGQALRLGLPPTHFVSKGDTLYSISRAYGVDLHSLASANGLASPYALHLNQKLVIPVSEKTLKPKAPTPSSMSAVADSSFVWPLKGAVLSKFGPKAGGLHNDGINIRGRLGEDVRAANDGVVIYAGDGLKSYGNLILLRHRGGWVTAYAHNERLLIVRGALVKQGEVIAHVGQTGGVSEPQLHFEIRRGVSAVDPMSYLAKN